MKDSHLFSGLIFLTALFAGSVFAVTLVYADSVALGVTGIEPVKTFATADGTFSNGWEWVFDVTVPVDETVIQLKFSDLTNGTSTIPAAGNIQFYSAQSENASDEAHVIGVQSADAYGCTEMQIDPTMDLDATTTGRQIQVTVEARVPTGTTGDSYTMSYGITSDPVARTITVLPDTLTKLFGTDDPVLTYKITDGKLHACDAFTGALDRDWGSGVGIYRIIQGTLALDSRYTLNIGLSFFKIDPAHVNIILGNLEQAYDGTPKPVTVTTDPVITTNVWYGGSQTVPIEVGSYDVLVTSNDQSYEGQATSTLVITAP